MSNYRYCKKLLEAAENVIRDDWSFRHPLKAAK